MSVNLTALQPGALLGNVAGPLCTATATQGTCVTSAVFTNTSTGTLTISGYVVRSGGSPGPGSTVISGQALPPGGAYVAQELSGRNLAAGDAVWAVASVNGVVNCIIDGFTIADADNTVGSNVVA